MDNDLGIGRRYSYCSISLDSLAHLLQHGIDNGFIFKGIPKTAKFVNMFVRDEAREIRLIFEDESFPIVYPSQTMTSFIVQIIKKEEHG